MKSVYTKLNYIWDTPSYIYIYIYSYNHSCNRIDTIQTMRLKSQKPQLSHNCFSRHSNSHLISPRRHDLITWWRSTNYSIKTMRITNAFNETMCVSFNEMMRFNNCYNFKRDTCCWTWVEPEPPFLCAWASSSSTRTKYTTSGPKCFDEINENEGEMFVLFSLTSHIDKKFYDLRKWPLGPFI